MIMIHGRNAAPENIVELAPVLNRPDFAYFGPAASGGTWYPYSFMNPREQNEPGISSGLSVIESLVSDLMGRGLELKLEARNILRTGYKEFQERGANRVYYNHYDVGTSFAASVSLSL